jgi:hypothetical protein
MSARPLILSQCKGIYIGVLDTLTALKIHYCIQPDFVCYI